MSSTKIIRSATRILDTIINVLDRMQNSDKEEAKKSIPVVIGLVEQLGIFRKLEINTKVRGSRETWDATFSPESDKTDDYRTRALVSMRKPSLALSMKHWDGSKPGDANRFGRNCGCFQSYIENLCTMKRALTHLQLSDGAASYLESGFTTHTDHKTEFDKAWGDSVNAQTSKM